MSGALLFAYGLGALTYWMFGSIALLRDDTRALMGEVIFWPLYAVRFLVFALIDALKALVRRPA